MRKLLNDKFYIPLLLVMSLSMQAHSAAVQADNWGGGWHDGWGWGHMFFGSFMMLLFWGGLIILIVLAVRWMGRGPARDGDGSAQANRALDILEERFARGEIDKEEFEERKQLLSK
jgi:putative membrane protein